MDVVYSRTERPWGSAERGGSVVYSRTERPWGSAERGGSVVDPPRSPEA
ncbi:hypothetical protein GCM10010221_71430 [Streptomyces parvus]|nr:hypothetical protein [Streptomyces parvus]GGS62494.1 hypothetical protein GCM10010221_71430 [Streptomyces parvus]